MKKMHEWGRDVERVSENEKGRRYGRRDVGG